MFRNLSKKSKILLVVISIAIIFIVSGMTYAFFSAGNILGNSSTNNIVIQTGDYGDLRVRYDGGKNFLSSNNMLLVEGGDHLYDYIKFSVEYTGNVPQDTYMYFKDVTNTFCQYADGQTCTNDVEDTYVGDEYSYTTYYCDNETKYNNINSATDTDLSSCTIINTQNTPMPLTGENKYLSTTPSITFNNASTRYYVVVARLENKDTEQNYNQGKLFTGKVYVDINESPVNVYFESNNLEFASSNSLGYKILSDPNVEKSTAVPRIGKSAVTQDYINTNGLSENYYIVENGIYQTEDDDGISYFYRGHVERNYVKFAGFIWRIVRINGDGSIRIVLDGLTSTVKKNDPANTLCTSGCAGNNVAYNSNYNAGEPSVANASTALEYISYDKGSLNDEINTFYETYIYNEANSIDYREYLADSTFCSDTLWGDTSESYWYFSPYIQLSSGPISLKCNDNYRLKVSNGAVALTYPIATLSIFEIIYGGMNARSFEMNTIIYNKDYYLYNNDIVNFSWWTMTPAIWDSSGNISMFNVLDQSFLSITEVNQENGVRPVINLKADTLTTRGIGTSDQPYEVE